MFRFLETATPRSFDLLVIDPPKFASARKDLEAARKGYERLNALALGAAAPGAVLVTCSCSQNVDAETFERIVAAGAKQAGRRVRVFERRGPAADHPLPPGFSEGQYLKILLCSTSTRARGARRRARRAGARCSRSASRRSSPATPTRRGRARTASSAGRRSARASA